MFGQYFFLAPIIRIVAEPSHEDTVRTLTY